MSHALVLIALLWLAPPPPGDISVEYLHGGWMRGLHCSTESSTVWIAGEGGVIRRSTGAGTSFVDEQVPDDPAANVQLEAVFLLDRGSHAGRGWAVGAHRTILRRDPATASWSLVAPELLPEPVAGPADEKLTDVWAVESDEAGVLLVWVVGEQGVLWHVREQYEGGRLVQETWVRQDGDLRLLGGTAAPFTRDLFSVHGVVETPAAGGGQGTLHLYAGGDWGLLLHSTDQGVSFDQLDVPGARLPGDHPEYGFDIQDVVVRRDGRGAAVGGAFVEGKFGWVVGIRRFTDVVPSVLGEDGCAPAVPCAPATDIERRGSIGYGVAALPDGRFLAVSYGSDTWRSPANGTRWVDSTYEPLPSATHPLKPPLREVGLAGAGPSAVLYAVGHHGTVRRTLDPTAHDVAWEQVAGQFVVRLRAGDFLDRDRGWLAGGGGPIVRTADAGLTFTRVLDTSGGAIEAIDVVAEDSAVAVGLKNLGGGVLRPYVAYLDGARWHEHATGVLPGNNAATGPLFDVHAAAGRFWAVGAGGFAGFSDDGGASWTADSLPAAFGPLALHGARFLDAETGVVVGAKGLVAVRLPTPQGTVWLRLPVLASSKDASLVDDGLFVGELLAVDVHRQPGRAVAVGRGGFVFEFDPLALAFVEVFRDPLQRDLTTVAISPDGVGLFAGGADGAFLWYDAGAQAWKLPHSRTSHAVEAIVPVSARQGYIVSGQSLLNRYTLDTPAP